MIKRNKNSRILWLDCYAESSKKGIVKIPRSFKIQCVCEYSLCVQVYIDFIITNQQTIGFT